MIMDHKRTIQLEQTPTRNHWKETLEMEGLIYHSLQGKPYWQEGQCVKFTSSAIETLEDTATAMHQLCLEACGTIIQKGWLERMHIPQKAIPWIENSWKTNQPSIYGRFDFAWDGNPRTSPKLLEYNADTPTSLLESSICQWTWLKESFPTHDQLNSIHEGLVEAWLKIPENTIHFACQSENLEDLQNTAYLAETAEQAGKLVTLIDIGDIGYSIKSKEFKDLDENTIQKIFKLYPWEWMSYDPFFGLMEHHHHQFIEPIWKMMLSTKALLPILWELYPNHPNLLPAFFQRPPGNDSWVEKPIFGREGQGIKIHEGAHILAMENHTIQTQKNPSVWQLHCPLFSQTPKKPATPRSTDSKPFHLGNVDHWKSVQGNLLQRRSKANHWKPKRVFSTPNRIEINKCTPVRKDG